ncbi:uncharacterized protein DC041_0009964 [Schistosoma bovis]|uniref:Uncharacterized protein n=1 Tax=Schistosoma bovis TaxID=6184 RepID=A0A430Q9Y0_SCHBO|nr:uncharacterized protein DC041_0009964 [Schistosoma bovis]
MEEALEISHSQPCDHVTEIVTKKHCDVSKWQTQFDEAFNTTFDETMIHRGLGEMLDGYVALSGVSACAFYRELMIIYLNAKVGSVVFLRSV